MKRISGRREWNNHCQWSQDLQLLPHLALLLLRTSTSLVPLAGDLIQEEGLIDNWVRRGSVRHPALHRVVLWYEDDKAHAISLWASVGTLWARNDDSTVSTKESLNVGLFC